MLLFDFETREYKYIFESESGLIMDLDGNMYKRFGENKLMKLSDMSVHYIFRSEETGGMFDISTRLF